MNAPSIVLQPWLFGVARQFSSLQLIEYIEFCVIHNYLIPKILNYYDI